MIHIHLILLMLATILLQGCSSKSQSSPIPQNDEKSFSDYWLQNKAEISTYTLNQSRYDSIHDGRVVMIFVTEDFSKSRHVKLEDIRKHKSDAIKVMKLNMNREFVTGIYKYSMMSSVFTPLDHDHFPHSLKMTASSQDWCGQSFLQANWKGHRYEIQERSYFESEGDKDYSLVQTWLEDEIWTRIRVAPNILPLGQVKMIVSPVYILLSHQENKVYEAEASLTNHVDHYTYTLHYPELNRRLEIDFEVSFPYQILGWKETYGNNEITTGRILKSMMTDYWMHHHPVDEALRDSLDLE